MKAKRDVFGITKGRRLFEKVAWFLIAIICIVAVIFLMDRYVKDRTETVNIIVISENAVTQNTKIENSHLDKYSIIKKEYNEDTMFKWDDLESVVGSYATYYIKEGTPLYKDAIYGEKRYRNEWMYTIEEGMEVLTIPFDYRYAGGNILIPGDRVRIRIYYEGEKDVFGQETVEDESEETYVEPKAEVVTETPAAQGEVTAGNDLLWDVVADESKDDKKVVSGAYEIQDSEGSALQVKTIFNEIEVIDMLANGESIYEKYLELKDMTEAERYAKLQNSEFVKTIIPDSMIVIVTEKEAIRYLQALAIDSEFIFTILPRDMNETVLDKIELIENVTDELIDATNALEQEGDK